MSVLPCPSRRRWWSAHDVHNLLQHPPEKKASKIKNIEAIANSFLDRSQVIPITLLAYLQVGGKDELGT
jgi:hypothetical protein